MLRRYKSSKYNVANETYHSWIDRGIQFSISVQRNNAIRVITLHLKMSERTNWQILRKYLSFDKDVYFLYIQFLLNNATMFMLD